MWVRTSRTHSQAAAVGRLQYRTSQGGIVYIDEINKISRKSDNASIPRRPDVFEAESL
jgi:ATP-dependent protease Clp ATPase subunit